MTRAQILDRLIGRSWDWTFTCWDCAALVERELFGRVLPAVDVPAGAKWSWMIAAIDRHPERRHWIARPPAPHGIVTARDGALCLMGRHEGDGHIGVWLHPERKVIHCDRNHGVCFETDRALKERGWINRTYFEPRAA